MTRTSRCTNEGGCDYPFTVGLIPGVDVDIDGGIWPDSPFAAHRAMCPAKGREYPLGEPGEPAWGVSSRRVS